jgi:hypothetical protein
MRHMARSTRIDLKRSATLCNSDGDTQEVIILDVSDGGFRMQLSDLLYEGERVTLHDGHDWMNAEVKWAFETEAGAAFAGLLEQGPL